ncbi:MAG TPA: hypothetical protein VFX59_03695 [Polyangiales bacterium]|nr:hypothetical protein [Polyangiales bacterium]
MRRLLIFLVGCADTGQEHVDLPLTATGTAAHAVALGDATLTLTRADVAYGPTYLCASESGRAELCEVAVAEFLGTVPIRALEPAVQPLGVLNATTGNVRSGLFDYGISWLLTQNEARANPGAIEGHSAILEGTVTRGAESVRFSATIDAKPSMSGDSAVNGQSTRFTIGAKSALNIAADPHLWVNNLDADALFALDTDGDGAVVIPADSVPHESILQGMVSRAPLSFQWR